MTDTETADMCKITTDAMSRCPFCGSDRATVASELDTPAVWWGLCLTCFAEGPPTTEGFDIAREKWNDRTHIAA